MVNAAHEYTAHKIKSPSLRGAAMFAEKNFVGWVVVSITLLADEPFVGQVPPEPQAA